MATRRPRIRDARAVGEAVRDAGPVLTPGDLRSLLTHVKQTEAVSERLSLEAFLELLRTEADVREVILTPDSQPKTELAHYKPIVRYVVGKASPYQIALSTKPGSYVSHGSAVHLHALTDQLPKTIYVNKEQSPKPERAAHLTQAGIDRAFANAARTSNYTFLCEDFRVALLSGKNTGRLEVAPIEDEFGATVDATTLERTLVDIAVRPAYAGGPHHVLAAYKAARERASINTIIAILRKLRHAYPYHQAVGFYLERAGFPHERLERLRSFGIDYDFYLANKLRDPDYVPEWRLYVPKGL